MTPQDWLAEYDQIEKATEALFVDENGEEIDGGAGEARIDQAFVMEEHAAAAVQIIKRLVFTEAEYVVLNEMFDQFSLWLDSKEDALEEGDYPELEAALKSGAYMTLDNKIRGDLLDTWSSASRQHYIDTGRYLTVREAQEA